MTRFASCWRTPGADLRTVASLVWRVAPAWIWPGRHLYDRPARMRASLATVLVAWTVLTGLAAVFVQLTQAQPSLQGGGLARHPIIGWSYWVFDAAILVSVLAVAAGGVPVWWRMMGRARREHSRRDMAYLLSPVVVPALYLAVTVVTVSLVRRPGEPVYPNVNSVINLADGMVGPWWFLALIVLGFVAGGVCATGPGLALRRLRPDGPVVGRAAHAAALATAAMSVAGAASILAAVCLYAWAPRYAGYHHGWLLATYLPMVLLAAAVATVSAARGIRAGRSPATA